MKTKDKLRWIWNTVKDVHQIKLTTKQRIFVYKMKQCVSFCLTYVVREDEGGTVGCKDNHNIILLLIIILIIIVITIRRSTSRTLQRSCDSQFISLLINLLLFSSLSIRKQRKGPSVFPEVQHDVLKHLILSTAGRRSVYCHSKETIFTHPDSENILTVSFFKHYSNWWRDYQISWWLI